MLNKVVKLLHDLLVVTSPQLWQLLCRDLDKLAIGAAAHKKFCPLSPVFWVFMMKQLSNGLTILTCTGVCIATATLRTTPWMNYCRSYKRMVTTPRSLRLLTRTLCRCLKKTKGAIATSICIDLNYYSRPLNGLVRTQLRAERSAEV